MDPKYSTSTRILEQILRKRNDIDMTTAEKRVYSKHKLLIDFMSLSSSLVSRLSRQILPSRWTRTSNRKYIPDELHHAFTAVLRSRKTTMRDLSAMQAATCEGCPASLAAEYPIGSAAHQAGQVPVSNISRQSQKQRGAPALTTFSGGLLVATNDETWMSRIEERTKTEPPF